jgi:hypothetical protein
MRTGRVGLTLSLWQGCGRDLTYADVVQELRMDVRLGTHYASAQP